MWGSKPATLATILIFANGCATQQHRAEDTTSITQEIQSVQAPQHEANKLAGTTLQRLHYPNRR